jgi:hypothetical protein
VLRVELSERIDDVVLETQNIGLNVGRVMGMSHWHALKNW